MLSFPKTWINLEPGGHATWNKQSTEREILHDLTYVWNLKKAELLEAGGCQGLKKRAKWGEILDKGCRVSVMPDKFWRSNVHYDDHS